MKFPLIILFLLYAGVTTAQTRSSVHNFEKGTVGFTSDAPLEMIKAKSDEVRGLVNFRDGTFAFTIPVQSFQGFNSRLQQEHFNENYMESTDFPKASFAGKIIEKIDVANAGEYKVRAKGKLTVHGVTQERIIQASLTIGEKEVVIQSEFLVPLNDHNIVIPKIVQQKIAETIMVQITATAKR
jgi:polyisoprenoid-binding protein YceI